MCNKKIKIPEDMSEKKHGEFIKSIFKKQIKAQNNDKYTFHSGDVEKAIYEYFYKGEWRRALTYYMHYRKIHKINKCYIPIDETPLFMLIWDGECKYLQYFIEKANNKYIRVWARGAHITTENKVENQNIIVNGEFGSLHHPFFELLSEKWVDKIIIGTILYSTVRPVPVKEGWGEGKVLRWIK